MCEHNRPDNNDYIENAGDHVRRLTNQIQDGSRNLAALKIENDTLKNETLPAYRKELAKFQALCLTNVSEPIQYAAMKSLNEDVRGNTEIINERLIKLEEICKKMELEFERPDGAMYIFARTKSPINTSELSEELLNHGVAIAPGIGFGDYNEFFRISACLDIKTLIEGMDILKTRL